MAYIVTKPGNRHELRHSSWTPDGPRSRTLATFAQLDPEVIARAVERGQGVVTRDDVLAAARKAGVKVERSEADAAAARLLTALDEGAELSPALARLLVDRVGSANGKNARPVSDAEQAAAAWIGRTQAQRGRALRDLLDLTDSLPKRRRPDAIPYPVIKTTSP